MDNRGDWYALDQMTNGNVDRETGLTHTQRGVQDGWFYLSTGSWTYEKPPEGKLIKLDHPTQPGNVAFLSSDDMQDLNSVPCELEFQSASRSGNQIRGELRVRGAAGNAKATIYWGTSEGLTFSERWKNQTKPLPVSDGTTPFEISNVPTSGPVHLRALLECDAGKFWTRATQLVE